MTHQWDSSHIKLLQFSIKHNDMIDRVTPLDGCLRTIRIWIVNWFSFRDNKPTGKTIDIKNKTRKRFKRFVMISHACIQSQDIHQTLNVLENLLPFPMCVLMSTATTLATFRFLLSILGSSSWSHSSNSVSGRIHCACIMHVSKNGGSVCPRWIHRSHRIFLSHLNVYSTNFCAFAQSYDFIPFFFIIIALAAAITGHSSLSVQ